MPNFELVHNGEVVKTITDVDKTEATEIFWAYTKKKKGTFELIDITPEKTGEKDENGDDIMTPSVIISGLIQ